jgi:hypothetical protein
MTTDNKVNLHLLHDYGRGKQKPEIVFFLPIFKTESRVDCNIWVWVIVWTNETMTTCSCQWNKK